MEAYVKYTYFTDDNNVPEYNHYKLLESDYQAGTLHEIFIPIYEQLKEQYSYIEYNPPKHLYHTWNIFHEIRKTKTFEHLITHQDIKAYFDIMECKLSKTHIKILLMLDLKYYNTIIKYQKEKGSY